jgi:hypothetical protein
MAKELEEPWTVKPSFQLHYLGGVNDLVREALRHGAHAAESRLTSTSGDECDRSVDTAERRDINSLATDDTTRADTGRVFTGRRLEDGIDKDLDGVLVSREMDDLEGVLDNADSNQLLAIVTAVHHEGIGKTLHNRALSLAEALNIVPPSTVGHELRGLAADSDVILERHIRNLDLR